MTHATTTQLTLVKAVKAEAIKVAAALWAEMEEFKAQGLDTPRQGRNGKVYTFAEVYSARRRDYMFYLSRSQKARVSRGWRQDGLGIWALS